MRVRTAAILASASALRAPGTQRTTKLPQRLFSAAFDEPGDDYDVAAPPPESLEYLSVLAGGETYTREFKTCQSRSGYVPRTCAGAAACIQLKASSVSRWWKMSSSWRSTASVAQRRPWR